MNPERPLHSAAPSGSQIVEIRVRGHLDHYWQDWLEGMQANELPTGETVLTGLVADQAALIGLLTKLTRLNLTIVSIVEVPSVRGGCLLGPPADTTDT